MIKTNSLADLIELSLEKYAGKPAFSCLGQTVDFTTVEQQSRALAAWLQQESGLKVGDRVAIQLPNLIQYPIAAYAVLRAGMVIVNTNPLYTASEMRHQFSDSGAKAVIILSDLVPKLNEIMADTDVSCVIATEATDVLTGNTQNAPAGTHGFNDVIQAGNALSLQARPEASVDDVCILQYTGGTTGVSKGAMLTNGNVMSNARQTLERLGDGCHEGQETFVCPLPLYHIYAFCVNMVIFASNGNHNVLIPNPRDLDAFIAAMKPFRFTGMSGLNTLFVGLCAQPAFRELDFSALKLTVSGGTALTSAASDIWKEVTGCSVSEGYGLSETAPVLCLNEPGKEVLGTVGKPLIDTDLQLRGANGDHVAEGEEGEIVVKGPQVMPGYWQRPDETAKVFTEDGYFRTGDVAVRLPSGEIKIVDRIKDMIIVSGFNVYPNEIEDVLTKHPAIMEAAVIGEPDDKSGEKVCAYITVSTEVADEEVIAHCRESLTAYKVPKKITVMDELPKSTVGKILRRELRGK